MSSTDKPSTELFEREAALRGFSPQIIAATLRRLAPWVRRRLLTLDTRLYRELGIVDEDFVELAFGLWFDTLGRPITPSEVRSFPKILTLGELLDHIKKAERRMRSTTTEQGSGQGPTERLD